MSYMSYYQHFINKLSTDISESDEILNIAVGDISSIKTNISDIFAKIQSIETTISLINGELTEDFQLIINELKATGLYVPKYFVSQVKADNTQTVFDAPSDVTDKSFAIIICDSLAYRVISPEEFTLSDGDVCTIESDGINRNIKFKYPPKAGFDENGNVVPSELRWQYFITTQIIEAAKK